MRAAALVSAAASLTLVLTAAVGVRPVVVAPVPPASPGPAGVATPAHLASAGHAAEVRRIRAHFDSVLAELDAHDVRLAPERRARRARLVSTLRAYRDRGEFPHNRDFAAAPTPYFVDRETGALCAVAHLLAASGRRDLVDRVARADNNVWVPRLAGDTAFVAWLDHSGLTLAEAARIQVPYIGDEPTPPASPGRSAALTAGSAAAVGGALAASWLNVRAGAGGSRLGAALGLTAGAAAIGLGTSGLATDRVSPALGVANVAVGAASAWLATRGLLRHRRLAADRQRADGMRAAASAAPRIRRPDGFLLDIGADPFRDVEPGHNRQGDDREKDRGDERDQQLSVEAGANLTEESRRVLHTAAGAREQTVRGA
jgi:hypothetical protein